MVDYCESDKMMKISGKMDKLDSDLSILPLIFIIYIYI